MDRRQAIKKLAAGTALAAGGSVVLSSRDVAYAASAPGTGLTNVPGPSEPLPVGTTNNSNGTVTLSDVSSPSCSSGSLTRSYSWRINGFNINGGTPWQFYIRNSTDSETIREGVSGYSTPNLNDGTVVLRKTNKPKKTKPGVLKPLANGDYYDISMLVTWQCSGAGAYLQTEYKFSATYPNPPTVEVVSYNII